jgi:DNA helicase HerA-like ATPase
MTMNMTHLKKSVNRSSKQQQNAQGIEQVLTPPLAGRSMILGRTGSGKSTLLDILMRRYLSTYNNSRVLIVDSKPRFKAQWNPDGTQARRHYRNWSRGEYVEGSYRVDIYTNNIKSNLDAIWQARGRVAIAQVRPGDIADLRALERVAAVFYGEYSDRIPRLIVVDELADFFELRRTGGGIFWQTARSGRELNVALMAGSQRPSYIPTVVMTESDRLYLFTLDYSEDMKKVYSMGVPKSVPVPTIDHSFFFWDKFKRFEEPSGREYVLNLEK